MGDTGETEGSLIDSAVSEEGSVGIDVGEDVEEVVVSGGGVEGEGSSWTGG